MPASSYILGIDTSCDDTSMAILDQTTGKVLSNIVSSQIKLHQEFGGIVPEVASRAHAENISPVFAECLHQAQLKAEHLSAIAVTKTPGLIGCLLTGTSFAKGLAYRLNVPIYGMNHLMAHLFSPFIEQNVVYPFLGLVVSGGHTAFYHVESANDFRLIGQTVDDAAGEAFDKAAKLAGLDYPGGPLVDRLAQHGDDRRFEFKVARVKMGEQYLSFSGLKTAAKQHLQSIESLDEPTLKDFCASLQKGIVDNLSYKLRYFLVNSHFKAFALSGGVAMNSRLRRDVQSICDEFQLPCFICKPEFCTDNGAMVAHLALVQHPQNELFELDAKASVKIQARQLK